LYFGGRKTSENEKRKKGLDFKNCPPVEPKIEIRQAKEAKMAPPVEPRKMEIKELMKMAPPVEPKKKKEEK